MYISFGELLVDMIKKDGKFHPYPGGAPANFSVALARLGIKPKLIASVGKDSFGDMLIETIKKENINVNHIKRSDKKTTLVFIELKNAVPEFVFHRSADVDIKKEEISENIFIDVEGFHFGSLSLTENPVREALFHCLEIAKTYGILVSFSPNIRNDLWSKSLDEHLYEALKYVDVLIASENEFEYMFGNETMKNVSKKYNIKKIAVTRGKNGCILFSRTNRKIIQHPIFSVDVADTTGAGDAFAAGFVYSLLKNKNDEESIRFASAVAALSTTKNGAMSALPKIKEVNFYLNRNKKIKK
ncbi:MAG: carbohydrate kinase [Nanoarchaeota archaeon]|nr:carbohydrate kinase [Nanoarchaeota archaeon]